MERKRREEEPMSQMNLTMSPQPYNNLQGFQYYIPDYHAMANYPSMNMYNNLQMINGYPYQMQLNQEDPQIYQPETPENINAPKNQNSNNSPSDKQKIKPYINLLVNTVTNLMKEGKVTLKYLKEKTENKPSHSNSNIRNSPESSPSLPTMSSYKRTSSDKQNNINNSYENAQCENHLCKYIFNSNKDKFKTKIKGLKSQEKNLCKKCCEAVEKSYFCYYCNQIYRDDMTDSAKWVQCDYCKKWEHFDCELQKGKRYSTQQELNDVTQYMCPVCINEETGQKNMDNKIQKKLINKKRRGDIFDDQKCKKNQRKDLRNLKSEKCSELLEDIKLIESFIHCK